MESQKSDCKKAAEIRPGCRDIWNAFMVRGAEFSPNDIPISPCTAKEIPKALISYLDAKREYQKRIASGQNDYRSRAFVHFYIDDYTFDGPLSGIWQRPERALTIFRHYAGIITPDFSTYQDFPDPLKRYNIYRMRAFGFWASSNGISVINNVRWGTEETWAYCWDGIPKGGIVAVGTVASGLCHPFNRMIFERGILRLADVIQPKGIVVYGGSSHPLWNILRDERGIQIAAFPSQLSLVFSREGRP